MLATPLQKQCVAIPDPCPQTPPFSATVVDNPAKSPQYKVAKLTLRTLTHRVSLDYLTCTIQAFILVPMLFIQPPLLFFLAIPTMVFLFTGAGASSSVPIHPYFLQGKHRKISLKGVYIAHQNLIDTSLN
ncbi:hypothetical protein OIU74_012537 [Salix koriyanagi]|uniref:Uncharacterized protein n=1 Tax=Salix koriyanagi TaxID=2511006 RepID=A0A9Q0Q6X1_9ROSI|nr:hypothetical protein OIU74_012537 [Salix koriyanagi]